VALAPGARVQLSLAPDGAGILIRPEAAAGKKPASVLFDRARHRGPPVTVDQPQGLASAACQPRRATSRPIAATADSSEGTKPCALANAPARTAGSSTYS